MTLAALLFVLVNVLSPASSEARAGPAIALSLDVPAQVADVTWGEPCILTFAGNLTIADDTHEKITVQLNLDTKFQWAITPDSVTRYSSDKVAYVAVVTIPVNASDEVCDIKLVATFEDASGTPTIVTQDAEVTVISKRLSITCEPLLVSIKPGESTTIFYNVTNRATKPDSVSCMLDSSSEGMLSSGWEIDMPGLACDVLPGETVSFAIVVKAPLSARECNITSGFWIVSGLDVSGGQSAFASSNVQVIVAKPAPVNAGDGKLIGLTAMQWVYLTFALCAVGLLFVGGTEIGYFAFIVIFVVPLFVRLKKDKVLSHFTRGEIFGYIKANPGVHYMAILQTLELDNGVLAYHLSVLEREGYIKSDRDGLFKRFYPKDMKIPKRTIQLSRLQKDIIDKARDHPGISQSCMAKLLGESKQVVNYNIKALEKAGMIKLERSSKETGVFLANENAMEKPDEMPTKGTISSLASEH